MTQDDFRRLVRAGMELNEASLSYAPRGDARRRLETAGRACFAQAFECDPEHANGRYIAWAEEHRSLQSAIRDGFTKVLSTGRRVLRGPVFGQ